MSSDSEWEQSSDSEYTRQTSVHRRKRRKTTHGESSDGTIARIDAFEPLISALEEVLQATDDECCFEQYIEPLLTEYTESVLTLQQNHELRDQRGTSILPISRLQSRQILDELESSMTSSTSRAGYNASLIARKLKVHSNTLRIAVLDSRHAHNHDGPIVPMERPKQSIQPNPQVLDVLYSITTTPYSSSFLSRIRGYQPSLNPGLTDVDWETRAPWMDLMRDIRDHFTFMHPDRDHPIEVEAPIEYAPLRASHLNQVHELLRHAFWDGIDVSDSLQYSPEKCTIIATYKKSIVGCAFLSSPQETYITYLAVRPGWENAQIATKMLYHLITMNPGRDILLHVSIKNPAMLLYNRFGFKAEEFIVGFYEAYMDSHSRASKNAFRLRLRR
ncbi:unnamed protein product [Somion occarium]|uniref:N-acetyltransferase domain-containing protein n=1 Tax=Somion occarium TaxID=3059160 RepID=A0ABP1E7P1_9APHY